MVGCSLEQLAVPWSPRRIAEKYSVLQNAIELSFAKGKGLLLGKVSPSLLNSVPSKPRAQAILEKEQICK